MEGSTNKNQALYKTRLCDHFLASGECRFGAKCWFAHGREELRFVPRLDRLPSTSDIPRQFTYYQMPHAYFCYDHANTVSYCGTKTVK